MLKKEITYENFDGEETTDTFYFNVSKPEIIELELDVDGGFGKMMERIVEANNTKLLVKEFKRIILLAYGVKSEDGKRFIKSDELREEFSQTAAYSELFMQLALDADAAAEFIKGILPKDLSDTIEEVKPAAVESPQPPQVTT
jgi:hypothetical protein